LIPIRTIDAIDSRTDRAGRTFRASMDEAIVVNGETAIPRGADVELKLTRVQSPGDLTGKSELQLHLVRIVAGNESYDVESNVFQTAGSSQGQKTARNAAIGGAIGAAIGAITGGKKGAVIGATAGAGGGVAAAVLTKDQVRIDPETQLTFRLERNLDIRIDQ
jgi:hypothetical protein